MTSLFDEEVIFTEASGYNIGTNVSRIEAPIIDAEDAFIQSTSTKTAAGVVAATATQLDTYYSFITVPVVNNGVKLPQVLPENVGMSVMLINLSANNAIIYPYGTETINGAATEVLPANGTMTLVNNTVSTWVSIAYLPPGIIVGANCNTFLGNNAGNTTLTGTDNTGLGCDVMPGLTTGSFNTAVGSDAATLATTAVSIVAIGYGALASAVNSNSDIAVGRGALGACNGGGESDLAIGYNALSSETSPTGNVAIGYQSQVLNDSFGGQNVSIGYQTMTAATNSDSNVCVGYQAGRDMVTSSSCVFIGHTSGVNNTADQITGVGQGALNNNTTGSFNAAFGWAAMEANTLGADNAALGWQALTNNTTGNYNTALGSRAAQTSGTQFTGVTAVGYASGFNISNDYNTAVGFSTMFQNSGQYNTAVGAYAMSGTIFGNGSRCVAIGAFALGGTTVTGTDNVGIGYATLSLLGAGVGELVAIGTSSLTANTTGVNNTAVGFSSQTAAQTVNRNTSLGYETLNLNTGGSECTAVGYFAMQAAQGNQNTAYGSQCLQQVSGTQNTAMGIQSMLVAGAATDNTAVGYGTLIALTTGSFHTAIGHSALAAVTTASNLTAVGFQSLTANTSGVFNTAVGYQSMVTNSTGAQCTALGYMALALSTADSNTAIGSQSLSGLTSGTFNTAVGRASGLLVTVGSRNTFVGYDAGSQSVGLDSDNIYLGHPGSAGESFTIRIGLSGFQQRNIQMGIRGVVTGVADAIPVLIDSSGQLGTVSSSQRFKTDIADIADSSYILKFRPRTFKWIDTTRDQRDQVGFIAEEVAAINPFFISRDEHGIIETVKYHELITPAIHQIQQLHAKLEELTTLVQQQQKIIETLTG